MALTSICRKCSIHQQQNSDSFNGLIYSKTFHARYSRAPITSIGEVCRPCATTRNEAKVLGMMLGTQLTFTQHCINIAVKIKRRNNMLRALAGYTWGCDKETLLTTNQAIGRSILSYCCPVWAPSPKDTIWSRLQPAQNSTQRIVTSSQKMADIAEMHQEARELQFASMAS